jgi:hypothetical protein
LYAIATTYAVALVDQYDAVPAQERGSYRANLDARRLRAVVADLRNVERLQNPLLRHSRRRERIYASVGRVDSNLPVLGLDVAFHPGPEKIRVTRDVVLFLAGFYAPTTADTTVDIDAHSIPVLGGVVLFFLVGGHDLTQAHTKS